MPKEQRIAVGVTAGGIDVGGLLIAEAAKKISDTATPRLTKTLAVQSAGHRYTFDPVKIGKLRLDATRTAKRAYYAGIKTPPAAPTPGAAAQPVDVPLAVEFRKSAVNAFVDRVQRNVSRAPRNATLRITTRKMVKRRAKAGRTIDAAALKSQIKTIVPARGAVAAGDPEDQARPGPGQRQ